ncbi:MAG: Tm-1-like ATP-binding domain-containing protein, partial [Candidatus Hadarchaeales archaeon]
MGKNILIIGTLNTKEAEAHYLRKQIRLFGHNAILMDVSMKRNSPRLDPGDISNVEVARAAGTTIDQVESLERKPALEKMAEGAIEIARRLYVEKKLDGVLGYGGSTGESIAVLVQKALPLGIPKVLLTTSLELASGSIEHKDIAIFPSVTDMTGRINKVNATTLAHAAAAISGMVDAKPEFPPEKPVIVASQYGNTTPHIEKAKAILEEKGYEFISFHAVGTGGKTLEELVRAGMVAGVLDVTTHELIDWLVGGFSNAGPHRMEAAGEMGVPQVLVPGCLDMIQFWAKDTVPEKFRSREFYFHNPNSTLVRATKEESAAVGKLFAEKVNKAKGPTLVAIPLKGWSICDTEGGLKTYRYDGTPT